jgi:hypothetical protein
MIATCRRNAEAHSCDAKHRGPYKRRHSPYKCISYQLPILNWLGSLTGPLPHFTLWEQKAKQNKSSRHRRDSTQIVALWPETGTQPLLSLVMCINAGTANLPCMFLPIIDYQIIIIDYFNKQYRIRNIAICQQGVGGLLMTTALPSPVVWTGAWAWAFLLGFPARGIRARSACACRKRG